MTNFDFVRILYKMQTFQKLVGIYNNYSIYYKLNS